MGRKTLIMIIVCIYSITIYGQQKDMSYHNITNGMDFTTIDSIMVCKLGEKNAEMILTADSIVAQTILWEGCNAETKKLSIEMENIVKYTFCLPSMYSSEKKIYASFQPYLQLNFFHNGESISVFFDYGINKWRIDEKGKILQYCDLKNSSLLPLFYLLFPNNQLINISYKNIIK